MTTTKQRPNTWTDKALFGLIALVTIVSFAVSTPASANGIAGWTVMSVSGDVTASKNGAPVNVPAVGSDVPFGVVFATGKAGRVVLHRNGDVVEASPNSRMEVPRPGNSTKAPHVRQTLGTLLFKIKKRKTTANRFHVNTPYMTAVIKGTTFTVNVNPAGAALHVSTGLVEVTSAITGEVADIAPGQTAAVSNRPGTNMRLMGGAKKTGQRKPTNPDGVKAPAKKAAVTAPRANAQAQARAALPTQAAAVGLVGTGPKPAKRITKPIGAMKLNIRALTDGFVRNAKVERANGGNANGANAASTRQAALTTLSPAQAQKVLSSQGNTAPGNSGNSNGNSGNSNGNSGNSSAGGNSGGSSSGSSNAGGNSGGSSSGSSNAGGNSGGNSGGSANSGGNGGGNSGGNGGGNSGGSANSGGNGGGNSGGNGGGSANNGGGNGNGNGNGNG